MTLQKTCCAFLNTAFFMEREQLQEDSSTLLDCILKQCCRDHKIIPLMLFTTDFVPFLSRLNSDVGKSKMQLKERHNPEERPTHQRKLSILISGQMKH